MSSKVLLHFIRLWLPALICLAGLVVIIARGGDATGLEGGAAIIGAGLSVGLLNLLHRIGVSGDAERGEEDAARDYLDAHGYWPGEGPDAPAPAADPHAAPHKPPVEQSPHRRR